MVFDNIKALISPSTKASAPKICPVRRSSVDLSAVMAKRGLRPPSTGCGVSNHTLMRDCTALNIALTILEANMREWFNVPRSAPFAFCKTKLRSNATYEAPSFTIEYAVRATLIAASLRRRECLSSAAVARAARAWPSLPKWRAIARLRVGSAWPAENTPGMFTPRAPARPSQALQTKSGPSRTRLHDSMMASMLLPLTAAAAAASAASSIAAFCAAITAAAVRSGRDSSAFVTCARNAASSVRAAASSFSSAVY